MSYEVKDGVGIIPDDEMYIEDGAFKGCKELTSIVIPKSVKGIGSSLCACQEDGLLQKANPRIIARQDRGVEIEYSKCD